jgi:hypothetical protein
MSSFSSRKPYTEIGFMIGVAIVLLMIHTFNKQNCLKEIKLLKLEILDLRRKFSKFCPYEEYEENLKSC